MKSVITLSLVMMLLAFGAGNTNKDYTSFVQSSPRLTKAFQDKDTANPTHFQVLLIELCFSIESCGK